MPNWFDKNKKQMINTIQILKDMRLRLLGTNAAPYNVYAQTDPNYKVRWVDKHNNQINYIRDNGTGTEHPIDLPAVFVELGEVGMPNRRSDGIDEYVGTWRIHILQDSYTDSQTTVYSRNANIDDAKAFRIEELIQAVHWRLVGWAGTDFDALEFAGYEPDENHDEVQDDVLTYRVTIRGMQDPMQVGKKYVIQKIAVDLGLEPVLPVAVPMVGGGVVVLVP
jgi:hypothetical protein